MSLSIYSKETLSKRSRKALFCFSGHSLQYEDAILEGVRAKTGLEIDPYGNTVLYQNHIDAILGLIASDKVMARDLSLLKEILQNALFEGDSLVVVGD
jgi:hypothetical protein